MADKGKGKAVDDTAGTSSQTSGRTETAAGGGILQELPRVTAATTPALGIPPGASPQFGGAPGGGGGSGLSQLQWRLQTPTTLQQPLSNQASGSAPFGGQNQIANLHGNSGAWSGAGFGGFSQFADGHGGFSQLHSRPPAAMLQPTLGSQAGGSAAFGIHAASGQNQIANPGQTGTEQPQGNSGTSSSQFAGGGGQNGNRWQFGGFCQSMPPVDDPASLERDCTICKVATLRLWSATTVQGTRVGTPLPLCEDCDRKIFAHARPLQHLEQYLASTAVGCGAGSIPAFLAANGRVGWFSHSQWAGNNPVTPRLCVCCNFPAGLWSDWVPICGPCYVQCCFKIASYQQRMAQTQALIGAEKDRAEQRMAQALAQVQADKARAHQEVAEALAQGRGIVIGPQRQLDHGQFSSAPPPHAQGCHNCGALEPTRMSEGFPVCERCFNTCFGFLM